MKKRVGGAKHRKQNLPEESLNTADASTPKPKRKTKRALEVELSYAQHVISEQSYRLAEGAKRFEVEKKEWQTQRANRQLEMQAKVVESAAHMIESLARMVGGDGF